MHQQHKGPEMFNYLVKAHLKIIKCYFLVKLFHYWQSKVVAIYNNISLRTRASQQHIFYNASSYCFKQETLRCQCPLIKAVQHVCSQTLILTLSPGQLCLQAAGKTTLSLNPGSQTNAKVVFHKNV